MLSQGFIQMWHWPSCLHLCKRACVSLCGLWLHESVCDCVCTWLHVKPGPPHQPRRQVFLCPLKVQVFMLPSRVIGLVAMGMPQQKEACVWGPVAGSRGREKGRKGFTVFVPNTPDFSLRKKKKSLTQNRVGLSCGITLVSVSTHKILRSSCNSHESLRTKWCLQIRTMGRET